MDGADYGAGFVVEAVGCVGIAYRHYRAADDGGEIDVGFGGDFAGDEGEASSQQCFAGDAAAGVFGQAGVEDSVGNLVSDLIGVAFGHRFRRKKITVS